MAAIPLPVLSQMYFLVFSPPFTRPTVKPACGAASTNRVSAVVVELAFLWTAGADAVRAAASNAAQPTARFGKVLPMQTSHSTRTKAHGQENTLTVVSRNTHR